MRRSAFQITRQRLRAQLSHRWIVWLHAGLILLLGQSALAQNQIQVGSVTAKPGAQEVIVPITAQTVSDVTVLSVDLTFDRALCNRIADQRLVSAGRASVAPEEDGIFCPTEGRLRLALFDLLGGAAIPSGSGLVAEWRFSVRADAAPGSFPLALMVREASLGPLAAKFEAQGATLTILPSCAGDCDGDGNVSVDELVLGVGITMDQVPVSECRPIDADGDTEVSVAEVVSAVAIALSNCPDENQSQGEQP